MALDLPTKPREALGSAGTGHCPEIDLGLAELRRVGSQDEVTHHCHLATAAQRIARHGSNDRFAASGDFYPFADKVAEIDVHVRL